MKHTNITDSSLNELFQTLNVKIGCEIVYTHSQNTIRVYNTIQLKYNTIFYIYLWPLKNSLANNHMIYIVLDHMVGSVGSLIQLLDVAEYSKYSDLKIPIPRTILSETRIKCMQVFLCLHIWVTRKKRPKVIKVWNWCGGALKSTMGWITLCIIPNMR